MAAAVTMFFDLSGINEGHVANHLAIRKRPPNFYMDRCGTTLSVPIPLVVLCDASSRGFLESKRNELAPGASTIFVEKSLLDYDFVKTALPIVQSNRANETKRDRGNTPLYFLTVMMKFEAILIASQRVPHATHIIWLDIACEHIVWEGAKYLPSMIANLKPKVAVTYIHYRPSEQLAEERMKTFLLLGPCGIAATAFTVERAYVHRFFALGHSIFYLQLSRGAGHAEEQVLTYMFDRDPDLFTLTFGDYYSVICNYNGPVRDAESILRCFVHPAIRAGRKDLAREAAAALLKSYRSGLLRDLRDPWALESLCSSLQVDSCSGCSGVAEAVSRQ